MVFLAPFTEHKQHPRSLKKVPLKMANGGNCHVKFQSSKTTDLFWMIEIYYGILGTFH